MPVVLRQFGGRLAVASNRRRQTVNQRWSAEQPTRLAFLEKVFLLVWRFLGQFPRETVQKQNLTENRSSQIKSTSVRGNIRGKVRGNVRGNVRWIANLPGRGQADTKGSNLSDVAENVEDGLLRIVRDLVEC